MPVTATAFTPVTALIGGGLIGLAAVLTMATLGRVAGISGIVGGLFAPGMTDRGWRAGFTLGLVLAAPVAWGLSGSQPAITIPVGPGLLIAGGLLVGIGTTLGGGCTSGHGVCGVARLSGRSIAATVTFMLTAGVTVFVLRHVLGVW